MKKTFLVLAAALTHTSEAFIPLLPRLTGSARAGLAHTDTDYSDGLFGVNGGFDYTRGSGSAHLQSLGLSLAF